MGSIYSCHRQLPSAAFYRPPKLLTTLANSLLVSSQHLNVIHVECKPKSEWLGRQFIAYFQRGLSRDVSVAFRSMSKISFASFLSCLAFFSVSCAENDIKIAQHCFKKYFTFLKRKRKNPNHCHSHSHHGGLVENSLVRITRSNLPNPSISPSTNQR